MGMKKILDPYSRAFAILSRHAEPASRRFEILTIHSVLVANEARTIAERYLDRHPDAEIDLDFLREASLLHDIGVVRCHAPEIGCQGTEPYIRHGVEGRRILEAEGLPRHALICERHTGSGISAADVVEQELPLEPKDYLPLSLEEKIICVADKFYGKKPNRLWQRKPLEKIEAQISSKGDGPRMRWAELRAMFLDGIKSDAAAPSTP